METNNRQNNFNNPIIIFLVLALVGLGGYVLFSRNSNVSTTEDTTTNTQTPAVEQKIIPQAKTQVADQATHSCDAAAKNYFDTYKGNNTAETVNLSYENYYNQNGSCYVLVSYNLKIKDLIGDGFSLHITYTLVDLLKKNSYGNYLEIGNYSQRISYEDSSKNRLDDCTVSGTQCHSLEGFLSSVKPYIGN